MLTNETRLIRSAVCPRCGCACDDVDLTVSANRIVEARNACPLGRSWFLKPRSEEEPPAILDGEPATEADAVAAAARLLSGARRPLIWGLTRMACEGQRLAIALAERLRGVIDPAAGPNHVGAVEAFQEWGEVSATLGEVAQRSGTVVLWLADPARSHPRLLERWRLAADDASRVVRVELASAKQRGADRTGGAFRVAPGRELELLWILRERARSFGREKHGGSGDEPTATDASDADDLHATADRLLGRLRDVRYVLWVFDAAATDAAQQHALRALAATLNALTRVRLFPLRGGGNRIGAEAVLTWQTGFPIAVDFSTGAPQFNGGEASAARLLQRNEPDAALVVCSDPDEFESEPAFRRLSELPRVVVDSETNSLDRGARVVLRSAPYGLASGGLLFRMDGVALALRPALRSRYPSEEAWLGRILADVSSHAAP